MTEEQYRELVASNQLCSHGIAELKTQMSLIVRLLNGNPDEDIVGVRPRLRQIEEKLGVAATAAELTKAEQRIMTLETEWAALKNKYKGAMWVLGILGVANAAQLIALARFLLGGP